MNVIPDPEHPQEWGIDENGDIVYAVWAMPDHVRGVPSLSDLRERGRQIGWTKGLFGDDGEEAVD